MRRIAHAALAAMLLAGCQPPQQGTRHSPGNLHRASAATADRELGRKVYNFRCYYCHGYSGDARTLASTFLDPKPRDFTAATPAGLPRAAILAAVRDGRPATAMKGFGNVLSAQEIEAVTNFVRDEFVLEKARNTRYHTAANGWPDHERYRAAFPFATGEIALDTPWEQLTPPEAAGKRLYLSACVTCHDRSRVRDEGAVWELTAVSYPPNVDACEGCHRYSRALHGREAVRRSARGEDPYIYAPPRDDPFAVHDVAPRLEGMTARERRGERLFQRNCAFCHAADGSGRNWIGAFLEPHPRDLSNRRFMSRMSREKLAGAIRDGLPGTSMPAWKSVLKKEDIEAVVAYLAHAFGPSAE